MRFEVPQFIEVEDKIIGPLTWKQFIFLAGGGGVLLILFLSSKLLFVVIGIPIGALAAALAFHKVNNRSFTIYLEAIVTYYTKSKLYLWQKEQQQTIIMKAEVTEELPVADVSYTSKGSLASLSNKLEHQIDETSS